MTAPGRTPGRDRAGGERGGVPTVLVVEATDDLRDVLTEFLARLGLIVVPVAAAEHAEVMCEKLDLDLVLLGTLGAGHGAGGVADRLRAWRPRAAVVALAALAGEAAPGAEGDARPLDLGRLRDVVTELLGLPTLVPRRRSRAGGRGEARATTRA